MVDSSFNGFGLVQVRQTTKFWSANFQKNVSPCYIILRIHRLEAPGRVAQSVSTSQYDPTSKKNKNFAGVNLVVCCFVFFMCL